ncbi:stage II sporulation protein M [Stakelama saccharophila]|uniref:Stage II sporulation protein M n=1 Tax=Stakelama saccharophila TaxID=3075605 RepID=A0ABZ0BCI3_9SPHN|nr:stage II sporulation protein M [Stakelama sp. W311]WNO54775.1 stage II sporulation protein M [Stakelama sp. W311]
MNTTMPRFAARHFRAEREADWRRLEDLLDRVEHKSLRRLTDADLMALPRLYRAALSALSVARDTSLDAAMIAYLEDLCTRAYFVLYGCREPWGRRLASYFRRDLPHAVRAIAPEAALTAALFFASAVAAYFLVRSDPAWFSAILPEGLANGRNMQASADYLRGTLYNPPQHGGLEIFATFLFTHNSQITILSFALGFAFGIPTMFLIAQNGAILGALYAAFVPHGLGVGLTGWLAIHGTTEISAIILAGGAGLHIGRAVALPGREGRVRAAAEAGKRAALVMIGVVLMLLVAGLLEGFGRQLVTDDAARFAVAGVMLCLWIAYFGLSGRRHDRT